MAEELDYFIPSNPRLLWHWAYFNGRNSVMAHAVDVARIGINSNPSSGMSGSWKKTKAGSTDFGGFSDSSRSIWIEQQKQKVRFKISNIPYPYRAFGNLMYMPDGEASHRDLKQVQNYLFKEVVSEIDRSFPKLKPEKFGLIPDLIDCALAHYREAISPAMIDKPCKSFFPKPSKVKLFFEERGKVIDVANWRREWRGMWCIVLGWIKDCDCDTVAILYKTCL